MYAVIFVSKQPGDSVLIIASLKPDNEAHGNTKTSVRLKVFMGLKSNEFNIGDTNLSDLNRISNIVAALSVVFIWADHVGILRSGQIMLIQLKNKGERCTVILNTS